MRKVFITAGPVYGRLDDNKLLSNRSRGIWALCFAQHLLHEGDSVTLLIPDIFPQEVLEQRIQIQSQNLTILRHNGFESYQEQCLKQARKHDAAIMAAAVVNWIPAEPVTGKMSTQGYVPGQVINIPFKLADRVIEKMRLENPKLNLIGCKMLSGSSQEELFNAAHHLNSDARCRAVIANDLKDLRTKHVVMADMSIHTFENNFNDLYGFLSDMIHDEYYLTDIMEIEITDDETQKQIDDARARFTELLDQYRDRMVSPDGKKYFGAIAVRITGCWWLISPREKDQTYTADDAVIIYYIKPPFEFDEPHVRIAGEMLTENFMLEQGIIHASGKASLNAPLLIRAANQWKTNSIIHLHEMLPDAIIAAYAPPGSCRDNHRGIPGGGFNIKGHGFIATPEEIG